MTAEEIARVAVEFWRGSGARTIDRLDGLVLWVGESYHGPRASWGPAVVAAVEAAGQLARARVQWQASW